MHWVRRLVLAVFAAAAVVTAAPGIAPAATVRPNELDRRVDALSTSTLLSQPATALVDPDRQAAAHRLANLTLPGWIAMALFQAAALVYFWSSGAAAALRGWLRRALRAEWLVRFAFGAVLAVIARLAALLPAFYLFRVERAMHLSPDLTHTWLFFWIAHTLLAALVAGTIATLVLWLVDRTHQWYAYTIVAILGVCIAWSYASPVLQAPRGRAIAPLTGPVASAVDRALARGDLSGVRVDVERRQTSARAQALVVGLGEFRRVVLSNALVTAETGGEVVYRVTYALGHAIHADPLFAGLIEGGIIIVFSAIAVIVADRIGFRRDDDSLSRFALLGALLALVYVAAVPVRNAALRSYDFDADRYAVSLTGDPASAVRAIVRTTDQEMEEVCPSMAATLFLDAQPSPAQRIEAFNRVPAGCP